MMKPTASSNPPVNGENRWKISSSFTDIIHAEYKDIQADALAFVGESRHKVSHSVLKKHISDRFTISSRQAHQIISHLVANGQLSYTYEYGSSYLEISFHRPVRVGSRFFLIPPGWTETTSENSVPLRIHPGAAFGCGRHPTTRLALQGIEAVLLNHRRRVSGNKAQALDIGTGSGILAIAALKLGIARAIGIDRDACARAEATDNASLNHLDNRFLVMDNPVHDLGAYAPFTLILANLRYPTLLNLQATVSGLLAPDGVMVISGIKRVEQARILAAYAQSGFQSCWSKEDKGWVGIVLRQSAP